MRVLTHGLVLGAFVFARSVLVSGFRFRASRPGGRNSINSSIQRFSVLAQVGALCCSAFQFNGFRFWRKSGRFVARHFNSTVFGSGVSWDALLLGSGPRLHGSGGVASESFSTCRTPSSRGSLGCSEAASVEGERDEFPRHFAATSASRLDLSWFHPGVSSRTVLSSVCSARTSKRSLWCGTGLPRQTGTRRPVVCWRALTAPGASTLATLWLGEARCHLGGLPPAGE